MKKFVLLAVMLLSSCVIAGAQTTTVSDKTTFNGSSYVTSSGRSGGATKDIETSYNWHSSKETEEYKIYLHQYTKGDNAGQWTAYVFRVSKKTGKEYKYYLPDGVAIAKDIINKNPNIIK